MKIQFFVVLGLIVAATATKFDSSRCAYGPEFWCQHRGTAEQCGAIQYCEDNVWTKVSLKNDVCTDCKNFVGDIQTMLQNETVQNEIVGALKMVCADLGPYADECNSLVDQYGTIVLGLLASELDPASVCGTVGFCSAEKFAANYFKAGTDICSDCEKFMGDVQAILKNSTLQNEIEGKLVTECQKLGFKESDCSLIMLVGPQVFDFLASEFDPKTVCTAIKFCKSALFNRLNSLELKVGGSDNCADCKAFFGDASAMLKNTTIQNELVQDLLAVCNYAGSYQEECKLAIQSFLPNILTQLAGYLDPTTACPAIGFCPTIDHKQEIKQNKPVTVKDDKPCTDCKNFFGDVKVVLMNATNQATIVKGLEAICADLGPYADECKTYVDEYGQLAISFLASSMDAGTICNDIGFCASTNGLLKLTGDNCADCQAFFGDVKTFLENTTIQTMLMNELKSVCSLFGTDADDCKNLIDSYGPMVFSLLTSEIDPKSICTTIQFCSSGLLNKVKSENGDLCTSCKDVAAELDAYINNPTVHESIITALDLACTSTGSLAEECKAMIDAFAPKVLSELANLLDPDTFCSLFGFCSSQKKMVKFLPLTLALPIHKNVVAKTNVLPAIEMTQSKPSGTKSSGSVSCEACTLVAEELDHLLSENSTEAEIVAAVGKVCSVLPSAFATECNALVADYGVVLIKLLVAQLKPSELCKELGLCSSQELKLEASTECTLCEFVMKELDSLISENSTEQEIINALEKVCSLLPTTIQEDCNSFVDTYTPTIIELLKSFSPDMVCSALGLCGNKATKKHVSASAECVLCEFVMEELEKILSENSTEQEILNALEKVCSLLPTTLQDDCNNMIKAYGPEIFELLKTMSPDAICTAIELCTSSEKSKVSASGSCIICEFVMKELDQLLSENSTEEEIKAALDKVCSLLPSTISADCTVFVNKYADTIIQLLLMELDPSTVCKALTLCEDNSKTSKVLRVSSEETCDLCKLIVMYGDEYLVENSTINQVIKVLNSVCDVLQGDYKLKCQNLVLKHAGDIPKLLADLFEPTKVCQKLEICQESGRMLGTKECTYGPSYWCASIANAQKCNAIVHCKNHVWN